MPLDRGAVDAFALRVRLSVLEALVLKMNLVLQMVIDPKLGIDGSHQMILMALESTAAEVEREYLASPLYARLTDAERALLAEETREVIESLKSFASFIHSQMQQVISGKKP